ncbi:VOC family protein [Streptomyces albofaciens]|uniref:VOC family protein n=1 Tax=Streptomyces albofaciens TaxID=66866 RepID=UPI001FCBA409|nr:VOC family protein [Streptomyces albofaciens]
MFGSTRHTDGVHGWMRAGTSAVYVVSDDVDAVHRWVVDAGGEVLEPPHETRFGSGATAYVCTVRDPEGNLWTFGTYRGPSPEQVEKLRVQLARAEDFAATLGARLERNAPAARDRNR